MHPLLLLIADARFPTGGHTQSIGVESAVRYGDVVDAPTLGRYLGGRLAAAGVTEAAFAARTAAGPDDVDAAPFAAELDRELCARILAPRQRGVSRQLGRQLLRAGRYVADGDPLLRALAEQPDGPLQPVAFGALVGAVGGTPLDAARLQLHHLVAAGTTAAVRLLGLDPFEVTALHASLAVVIDEHARAAANHSAGSIAALPAWGSTLTEILAEDHGTWDGRLFAA